MGRTEAAVPSPSVQDLKPQTPSESALLVRWLEFLANADTETRNTLLHPFKKPAKKAGRPSGRYGDPALAAKFEYLVRPLYEQRDGRRYSDDALLRKIREEERIRKGTPRPNAEAERQQRKTMVNRLSAGRKAAKIPSRKKPKRISGKK